MQKRNIQKKTDQAVIIYQAPSGAIELRGDFDKETLWGTQAQIAGLFDIDRTVVTRHINNILNSKEVNQKSNVQKMHIAHSDKPVSLYSLDIILAVGYRANSARAIVFRKWATKTLKEHITKGYTINRKRIAQNYDAFMKAVGDIQALLPEHIVFDPKQVIELIKEFASTWVSLDAYDKETLASIGTTRKSVQLTGDELEVAIAQFKSELVSQGQTTELFAQKRLQESVAGIVGNVMQSFGGKPVYSSVEERAAHLLYFMVKNHPFIDGNKRSDAFAFVWFLRKARAKKACNINPPTLTALTLLIAESDAQKKEQMVALVTQLLK